LIEQSNIASTKVQVQEQPESIELNLNLEAYCNDVTVEDIEFSHEATLYDGSQVVTLPFIVKQSEPITLRAKPNVQPEIIHGDQEIDPLDNVYSFEVLDATITNGPVTISGNGAKTYLNDNWEEISIDGLFEDWNDVDKIFDEDKVDNPNVDLTSYAIDDSAETISFYLNVEGSILAGTELPVKPYIYHREILSDNKNKVKVDTQANNPLPDLPELTGEDAIYMFLDVDNDQKTGYCANTLTNSYFPVGADYMVELTGQNGDIKTNVLSQFTGTDQTDFEWGDENDIPAMCSGSELETQVEWSAMNQLPNLKTSNYGVYIHIVDWSGEADNALFDASEQVLPPATSEKLTVATFSTRESVSLKVETYKDPLLAESTEEFEHGDEVFVTLTDGYHTGGVATATVFSDHSDPDLGDEIIIMAYDDGTHYDTIANDGIYTGSFIIQSVAVGGETDDELDTVAVESMVKISGDLSQPYYIDPKPLAPEFSDILVVLSIVGILMVISVKRRRRW
jgi:hypothetical protein